MAALSDEQARDLWPDVLRLAAWLVAEDAEDLCQDAFLGALRRATVPEDLRNFLFASVRNAAISRHRRAARRGTVSLDAPARFRDEYAEREGETTPLHARLPGPDDVAEEATTRAALTDALAALAGERYAPALVAFGLGYPQPAYAARAGLSPLAVKMGIHRLRHGPLARLSPW